MTRTFFPPKSIPSPYYSRIFQSAPTRPLKKVPGAARLEDLPKDSSSKIYIVMEGVLNPRHFDRPLQKLGKIRLTKSSPPYQLHELPNGATPKKTVDTAHAILLGISTKKRQKKQQRKIKTDHPPMLYFHYMLAKKEIGADHHPQFEVIDPNVYTASQIQLENSLERCVYGRA